MHLCCWWKQVASGRIEGVAGRVVFHAELVPYFDYPEIFCSVKEKNAAVICCHRKKAGVHSSRLFVYKACCGYRLLHLFDLSYDKFGMSAKFNYPEALEELRPMLYGE